MDADVSLTKHRAKSINYGIGQFPPKELVSLLFADENKQIVARVTENHDGSWTCSVKNNRTDWLDMESAIKHAENCALA